MTETAKANPDICTASLVERRRCPVVTASYTQCEKCPWINADVNLGQPGLRGGVETLSDLVKWRKIKSSLGIAHGDGE